MDAIDSCGRDIVVGDTVSYRRASLGTRGKPTTRHGTVTAIRDIKGKAFLDISNARMGWGTFVAARKVRRLMREDE